MKGKTTKLERIARNDPDPARRQAASTELQARDFRHRYRVAHPDNPAQPPCTTKRHAPPRIRQTNTPKSATMPSATISRPTTAQPPEPILFQRIANASIAGHQPVNGYTVHRGDAILGVVWRDGSNKWHKAHTDTIVGAFDQLTPTTYPTRKTAAEALAGTTPPKK